MLKNLNYIELGDHKVEKKDQGKGKIQTYLFPKKSRKNMLDQWFISCIGVNTLGSKVNQEKATQPPKKKST